MATSKTWAQDIILCDLCDKPTQQFCNSCQVSLCDDCVGKHRGEFQFLSHEIVPFLDRKIQIEFPECQEHSGQRCQAYCKICKQPACMKCILSGPHKGHDADELAEIYERRILEIKQETHEIKIYILPNYQKEVSEITIMIWKAKAKFDDLRKESKNQRQLWHKEVDNIFDKIDSMRMFLRDENLNSLELYQNKIRNLLSEMTKTVEQNEKILKSKKLSGISKYQSRLEKYHEVQERINLQMPFFATKLLQGKELSIEIGDFKAILNQVSHPNPASDVSRCYSSSGVKQLLNDAKVIATVPTNCKPLHGLACVGEEEVWVSGDNSNIIRVDKFGLLKDTVMTIGSFSPRCISVTKEGELIYIVYYKGTVNIVRNGKTKTLIPLQQGWNLESLCCTRSGDIFVYMFKSIIKMGEKQTKRIARYQGYKEIQEIYHSFMEESDSLFMAENNNGDICISISQAKTVVVLFRSGEVKFRYYGTSGKRKASFQPRGITTDYYSRIIVTDTNNDCLHILDQNGQILRYVVERGLEKPFGLSIDNKGRLWVGLRDSGKIKVVEYLA